MSNDDKKSPMGMLALVGLCGICCAAPLLLVGGGSAAIAGYFGDNLWAILGGLAVIGAGLYFMKSQSKGGNC